MTVMTEYEQLQKATRQLVTVVEARFEGLEIVASVPRELRRAVDDCKAVLRADTAPVTAGEGHRWRRIADDPPPANVQVLFIDERHPELPPHPAALVDPEIPTQQTYLQPAHWPTHWMPCPPLRQAHVAEAAPLPEPRVVCTYCDGKENCGACHGTGYVAPASEGLHQLREKVSAAHQAFLCNELRALDLAAIECDIYRLMAVPSVEGAVDLRSVWDDLWHTDPGEVAYSHRLNTLLCAIVNRLEPALVERHGESGAAK